LVAACRISSNASISACEKAQRWREAAEIFAAASAGGGAGGGDGGEGNSVMQSHRSVDWFVAENLHRKPLIFP